MKKLQFTIKTAITFGALLCATLVGCGEARNTEKCLQSVKNVFPNSKIYSHPNNRYTFLVLDSLGLREVETLNITNADISGIRTFTEL